jgi:NAD(P)-dependent dehydrogenase (short-subunit alcohol dehydrogenase family)
MADPRPTFVSTCHHAQYPEISDTNPALSQAGKVVFITGGGKGIGKSIATSFAKAGAKAIIITGRTPASLEEAKASLSQYGIPVETFVADVADETAIQQAFSTAHRKHGPIDVLVSNAGYLSVHVPISESPLQDYWQGFETNVKGGLVVTQAFLKVAAPDATLISISSGAAHIPYIPGYSGYSASKLAFWRIMEYFQAENPDLRVFNLQPGRIESDMSRKAGNIPTRDDISAIHTQIACVEQNADTLQISPRVYASGSPPRNLIFSKVD